MTGGGFGGCTITMVEANKKDKIMEEMKRQYKEKTGIDCDIFATTPCEGAHVISNKKCECKHEKHSCESCKKSSCRSGSCNNCCVIKDSFNEHPIIWITGVLAVVGCVAYAVAQRKH